MALAQDYVDTILRLTGEKTDFSEPSDEAVYRALDALNQYIEMLRERGCTVNSSQTEIESLAHVVNFPSYARKAIELNTAVLLWPMVNPSMQLPPSTEKMARKQQAMLMYRHGPSRNMKFPSTLPRGSGNTGLDGRDASTFYPNYDVEMYPDTDANLTNEPGDFLIEE